MATLKGELVAESPIYRGNGLKTLFSRREKTERTPVELPGRPDRDDTGKTLMDAFMGFTNRTRKGEAYIDKLLDQLYNRLFDDPNGNRDFFRDITIDCGFTDESAQTDRFYDLRMGIKLNRDRMSMEEKGNYKVETVFKSTKFNVSITYPDAFDNTRKGKLYLLLKEMVEGRFWFGSGKTKGLGKLRLELDETSKRMFNKLKTVDIPLKKSANAMDVTVSFKLTNPLLVAWPFHDEGQNVGNGQRAIATWIDTEIEGRNAHLRIKEDIANGRIRDWSEVKDGRFLQEHARITGDAPSRYRANFGKAVENDKNIDAFLTWYRGKAEAVIEQPDNCDFRLSGNRVQRSRTPYDRIFMRMLKWKPPENGAQLRDTGWEIYISGGTIKGAYRIMAEKIMRSLLNLPLNGGGVTNDTGDVIATLFGKEGVGRVRPLTGKIRFSDAYLTRDGQKFCSMDAIKIDPRDGKPIDSAKMDFLYGYGEDFEFKTSFFLDDVTDDAATGLFFHLLQEMKNGQIPLGGQKTSGMGWVRGQIEIRIKTGAKGNIARLISDFGVVTNDNEWVTRAGSLEQFETTQLYRNSIGNFETAHSNARNAAATRPTFDLPNRRGLISHALFSGYSGVLSCTLKALTPLHIKESGQPTIDTAGKPQGWDFFHMGPPAQNDKRGDRRYAAPSKSLKGMIRNIYTLLSDSTAAESAFGFVDGNNGYMGRIGFSFAHMTNGTMKWYGMPHHYQELLGPSSSHGGVRIFKHNNIFQLRGEIRKYPAGIAPDETDNTITPCRCADTGSLFQFDVRFSNLTRTELERLVTAVRLEDGLAHKLGKGKALGFGSCRIDIDFGGSTVFVVNNTTNDWRDKYTKPGFTPKTFSDRFPNGVTPVVIDQNLKELLRLQVHRMNG